MRKAQVGRIADSLVATVDGIGIHTLMSRDAGAARRARRTIESALDAHLPRSTDR